MAWSAPRSYSTGELVTAAMLNQEIRDNLNFLAAMHGARAYRATNQNITTATDTAVVWTAESYDTDVYHDLVTAPSRFTIPSGFAGYYQMRGQARFEGNNTNFRVARIRLNGTTDLAEDQRSPDATAVFATTVSSTTTQFLQVGDYVELIVRQSSGSTLYVEAGLALTFFELIFMGV
jgi:hypothetical protein